MISASQNQRLTQVTAGTPGGQLMRRFWQPCALIEELEGKRPVKPVRLLGENFVLFRDEQGQLGLLDRDCPHRGADLAFGRLEDGGLRCAFHGWLFDTKGDCLQTPAEPKGSKLCNHIKQRSYPVVERSGIIFAYLGEDQPPPFPAFDCFQAPDTHVFAFKGLMECNWLQALEVGIDPAHASFLHRFFEDEDTSDSYGKQFRAASAGTNIPMTRILREFDCPAIDVEPARYGLQLCARRDIDDATTHVRITNLYFPHAFVIPMSETMTITQWHVPIDDKSCYWYALFTSFGEAVDKKLMRDQRLQAYSLPDYRPLRGKHNNYGFDAEEQAQSTYTGMGFDINVHDQWAVESLGAIQDRTREHLGQSDVAIVQFRRMLLANMRDAEEGRKPAMVPDAEQAAAMTGPGVVDALLGRDNWREAWRAIDRKRREQACWNRIS